MNNLMNSNECCHICKRLETQLTFTGSPDTDNVKLDDKLSFCISEIVSFHLNYHQFL